MPQDERNLEIRRAELLGRLKATAADAPPAEEVEARDEQEADLLNAFLRGAISLKEYHEKDLRAGKVFPGEIVIPDFDTLVEALYLSLRDLEEARASSRHEEEHFQEATRLGFADVKILIRFYGASLRPGIDFALPKEGDEELIRQNLRRIIEAPEELSDLDQRQIKP